MAEEEIIQESAEVPFSVDMDKFRDSLPEELRNEDFIKNAKDVGSIAQMAMDNKRMVSQKTEDFINSIPKNGDDPTAVDTAYSKLGWPGADGKYEVTRPEKVEGIGYNEEREAAFLEIAKTQRFNLGQVNALIQMDHDFQKMQLAKDMEAATTANEALKTEWGDQYDTNKTEVNAILEKFGDDSLVKLFNDTELGSHAGFIKLLHTIGAGMIEKSAVGAGDTPLQGTIAKDEAQKKISAMYMDTEISKILENVKHPDHKTKNAELLELFKIVHGTEVVA